MGQSIAVRGIPGVTGGVGTHVLLIVGGIVAVKAEEVQRLADDLQFLRREEWLQTRRDTAENDRVCPPVEMREECLLREHPSAGFFYVIR